MVSLCIKQFIFICLNAFFTTHCFNFYVNNIYVSNLPFFLYSGVYKRSADILLALHIITPVIQITAYFLLYKYLFHLTVSFRPKLSFVVYRSKLRFLILSYLLLFILCKRDKCRNIIATL